MKAQRKRDIRPYYGILRSKPKYVMETCSRPVYNGLTKLYKRDDITNHHFQLQNCLASLSSNDIVYSTETGISRTNLLTG